MYASYKTSKKALDMFPSSNAMTFQHIPKKPDYDEFLKKFKRELEEHEQELDRKQKEKFVNYKEQRRDEFLIS